MPLEFDEYQVKKIVNTHKHVDGPWYWGKYTAHPYVGCRSGCSFCYLRGNRYLGSRDPESFDTFSQVKTNAVELLRAELPRLRYEIISVGDWQQPAEERYKLSRRMLEVVLEHGFPLFIVMLDLEISGRHIQSVLQAIFRKTFLVHPVMLIKDLKGKSIEDRFLKLGIHFSRMVLRDESHFSGQRIIEEDNSPPFA